MHPCNAPFTPHDTTRQSRRIWRCELVITDVFILVSVVLMFGEFVCVVTGRSIVGLMLAVRILSVSLTCVVLTVTVHNHLVLLAQRVLRQRVYTVFMMSSLVSQPPIAS